MGVTLEESRFLVDDCHATDGVEVLRLLRKHGVRRMNVYANTGQSMYAFNDFQHSMLPECYKPPTGTHSGNVKS